MRKILQVLDGLAKYKELRKSRVPLFLGPPGTGKTSLINKWAADNNRQVFEFITSQRSPFEISGMAIPSHENKKMTIYDYDMMDEMKDGDILFFDELLNGNPVTLNACLTLLEGRKTISGKPLKDIIIIAAANPQGAAVITPQVKERFIYYEISPDKELWKDYIVSKYQLPDSAYNKLWNLVEKEDFKGLYNFNSCRSLDKAIDDLIRNVPTPYADRLSFLNDATITIKPGFKIYDNSQEKVIFENDSESEIKKGWLDLYRLKFN